MKLLTKISLAVNLIFFAIILYLVIKGEDIVKKVMTDIMQTQYRQKLSMFEACPADTGAIVFLGNSITEGGNWNELFDSVTILNRGIGGDITKGVLNRMDEVIRHQPSKLFILIGTNDLAWGIEPDTLLSNYRKILKTVMEKSPETRIYVQSILPVGEKVMFRHKNHKIAPVNVELEKICAEMNVVYIDLYSKFTASDGYLEPAFTNDNLHLMGKGYLHWIEIIRPYVYE